MACRAGGARTAGMKQRTLVLQGAWAGWVEFMESVGHVRVQMVLLGLGQHQQDYFLSDSLA